MKDTDLNLLIKNQAIRNGYFLLFLHTDILPGTEFRFIEIFFPPETAEEIIYNRSKY